MMWGGLIQWCCTEKSVSCLVKIATYSLVVFCFQSEICWISTAGYEFQGFLCRVGQSYKLSVPFA